MRFTFAVFLFAVGVAHADPVVQLTVAPLDTSSAYQQASTYIIATPIVPGSQEFKIPYTKFVPVGETRAIHISYAFLSQRMFISGNSGSYDLLIESPCGSWNWKATLAKVKDSMPPDSKSFSDPVIMSSADCICVKANTFTETLTPEQTVSGLIYRIGP